MVSQKNLKIGILTGPTATGKSALALELAVKIGGVEIVNADSLLVYKKMDIGTAKPSFKERSLVPHHLIDIVEPDQEFTTADFVREAQAAIRDIESRGKRPLFVGGTGFYLKALLYGLWKAPGTDAGLRAQLSEKSNTTLFQDLMKADSNAATRIGPNDRYRLIRALEVFLLSGKTPSTLEAHQTREPDPRFTLWIVDRPNSELHSKIQARTQAMLEQGLIEEVQNLRKTHSRSRALQAVGYAEVQAHLDGTPPSGRKVRPGLPGLQDEIELATRQLVKKQRTWFRGQTSGRWFEMDRDRSLFLEEFAKVYG